MTSKTDVTVFLASDGEEWAKYFVSVFTNFKELSHTLVCLNDYDAKRPPGVTSVCVQSPVLLLLATPELLDYMKNTSGWFSVLLKAIADPRAVVVITFDDKKYVEEAIRGVSGTSRWTFVDPGRGMLEQRQAMADVLNIIETSRLMTRSADVAFELFPEHISEPGTSVAIVFNQEVKDNVKVVVGSSGQECSVSRLNPSVLTFNAPAMPPGTYDVTVMVAGQSQSCVITYLEADYSAFDACRFWSQCVSVSDGRSLDRFLSDVMTSCQSHVEDVFCCKKDSGRRARCLYPTSIHFAAANGLREFCSSLMSIPGSSEVCNMRNLNDDNAVCLALKNNFIDQAYTIAKRAEVPRTSVTGGGVPPPPCGRRRLPSIPAEDAPSLIVSPRATDKEENWKPDLPSRSGSVRYQTVAEKIPSAHAIRIPHCISMPNVNLAAAGAWARVSPDLQSFTKAISSNSTASKDRLPTTPDSRTSQVSRDSGVSQVSRDSGVSHGSFRDSGVSHGPFRDSGLSQMSRDSGVSQESFRDSKVSQVTDDNTFVTSKPSRDQEPLPALDAMPRVRGLRELRNRRMSIGAKYLLGFQKKIDDRPPQPPPRPRRKFTKENTRL